MVLSKIIFYLLQDSYGMAAVFSLESSEPDRYQDGSAAEDSEITQYHSSRPALPFSVMASAACGPLPLQLGPFIAGVMHSGERGGHGLHYQDGTQNADREVCSMSRVRDGHHWPRLQQVHL